MSFLRARHLSRLRPGLTALTLVGLLGAMLVATPAKAACEPNSGCIPSREECASGRFEGYTDGGPTGRFALCLTANDADGDGEREVITYVAGTITPGTLPPGVCGAVTVAEQDLASGEPESQCDPRTSGTQTFAERLGALGLDSCARGSWQIPGRSEPFAYESCVGEIRTFDGIGLDTRVTFPAGASGPLPTVLLLHGWSGDRSGWQDDRGGVDTWNRMRFVIKGYATVATTARGFYASCGQLDGIADDDASGGPSTLDADDSTCAGGPHDEAPDQVGEGPRSWTHIAEPAYEGRDSRHVLGLLVDAGLADERRLAATGDSYGGAQSWQLATAQPWDTPAPGQRQIQLAAAVPLFGWTDLLGALAPNGRASDGIDQSASHDEPFGVVKESWFSYLHQAGFVRVPSTGYPMGPLHGGRYNRTRPDELHSYLDGWAALFASGEPYAPAATQQLAQALRAKSVFYAEEFFASLTRHPGRRVPVFAVQSWNDTLFPAVEALQMYRRLKAADPGYPIWLRFTSGGHGPVTSPEAMQAVYDDAGRFVDAALLGADLDEAGLDRVASYSSECPDALATRVAAGRWDSLAAPRSLPTAGTTLTTTSAPRDAREDAITDPVTSILGQSVAAGTPLGVSTCAQAAGDGSRQEWTWPVAEDATLLGLPALGVRYALSGVDATLITKLWDVDPAAGTRTLITRGRYRLSTATGDAPEGTVTIPFDGSHWTLRAGHRVAVEVTQTDAPFLRPDSLPSTVTWTDGRLTLPLARDRSGS